MKTNLIWALMLCSSVCFAQIEAAVPSAAGRVVKMQSPQGKTVEVSIPDCEQKAVEGLLQSGSVCMTASDKLAHYEDESHFVLLNEPERGEFLSNYVDVLSTDEAPIHE